MAEYSLLTFPDPIRAERGRALGGGGGSGFRSPAHGQQGRRLTPQFRQLQQAIDRRRVELQGSSQGIQPEQVLVLKTVGPVDEFATAIRRIEGLEWLAEFDVEDIEPAHGFELESSSDDLAGRQLTLPAPEYEMEEESNSENGLRGRLFMIMSNQQALSQMRNLFNQWKADENVTFPRGLAKLKEAFVHLYEIRPWGEEDRFRETGLLEDWNARLEDDERNVPFEAELWYRDNPVRQRQAEAYLRQVIESLEGIVGQQCVIGEIGYHSVLGSIPSIHIPDLLKLSPQTRGTSSENPQIMKLLRCDEVMYLRPSGQCGIYIPEEDSDHNTFEDIKNQEPIVDEPIVALFDGMPLAGHRLLNSWTTVDDPDGFESAYQASERIHGTTMVSLICHGDLNEGGMAIDRKVYVRPILKPRPALRGQSEEAIPPDVLPVDLIHRAVRRLFESENGEPPLAPTIRVINLSIGDRSRLVDREVSPLARLLDWLAWKYNVLFIVSAGNHGHDLRLNVPTSELDTLDPDQLQKAVIEAIASDTRHRRLLSPGETFNGLTVGATHADASDASQVPSVIDPFALNEVPSVVSAHGPGYGRSVKPDILLDGGRQFLYRSVVNNGSRAVLKLNQSNKPPGQRVAVPGDAGRLDQTHHTRGTSNATALASRWATLLYELIERLRSEQGAELPEEYDTVLLKTLLTHGSGWRDLLSLYRSVLGNNGSGRDFRNYLGGFLGYGMADPQRVMNCTDQRATILGVGQLSEDEGDVFTFPLPPSISAKSHKRRLTVTLAWLTPVNFNRRKYRVAHLWFDARNAIAQTRQFADYRAVRRGTVQHEVLEGEDATPFEDGENISIKVSCRSDADQINEPIRYGLAVTLEVADHLDIPIYQEVRDRIAVPVSP